MKLHSIADNDLPTKGGYYFVCSNNHWGCLCFCGDKWFNPDTKEYIELYIIDYWTEKPELPVPYRYGLEYTLNKKDNK